VEADVFLDAEETEEGYAALLFMGAILISK